MPQLLPGLSALHLAMSTQVRTCCAQPNGSGRVKMGQLKGTKAKHCKLTLLIRLPLGLLQWLLLKLSKQLYPLAKLYSNCETSMARRRLVLPEKQLLLGLRMQLT